ncbi:hypothetical protein ACLOJK_023157 [Asimina triloba]
MVVSAPREGETLWDHCDDNICLNEWIFKAGVRIPFEFGISELLHIFGVALIWIFLNSGRIIQSVSLLSRKVILGCVTFTRKRNTKIISNLPDSVPEWKLQHLVSLLSRKVMLGWITFAGKRNTNIVSNLPDSVPEWKLQFLYAHFSEVECLVFDWGLPMLVPHFLDHRTRAEERPKKKKRLGPTALDEEEEHLARQKEADLQLGLVLSREEARRSSLVITSLETSARPAPLGLMLSSVLVVDVEADITSLREPFKATGREEFKVGAIKEQGPAPHHCVDPGEAETPYVVGSWGPPLEKRPQARALKILGDLLPAQLRGIKECYALGLAPSLDEEELGLAKRMLLEFLLDMWRELSKLEERIHLIDGCASRSPSVHPWGVPGPEIYSGLVASGMIKGEQCFFVQLLERVNQAEALRDHVKEVTVELLSLLDTMKAKQDEARDNIEGVVLAKQGLERASEETTRSQGETSRLLSELSIVRAERDEVINSAEAAREEASEVEAFRARGADPDVNDEKSRDELEAVRGEMSMLQERVALLGLREAELLTESEVAQYLRSDVQWRREEFEHSHHSRSGYVKALPDVVILFLGIDLSSLYQTP